MDVVVTVPKALWTDWIDEGDLPEDVPSESDDGYAESHFWISAFQFPKIEPGELVYIVAHGRLRGYAPLVRFESWCRLYSSRACLVRHGGAVAVTLPEPIRGFQGWRYRWWDRSAELPFPAWQTEGVA